MRRVHFRAAVMGLSLGAMALTPSARAGANPAPSSGGAPQAGETSTPLALRPSKPLQLNEESPHTNIGWVLGTLVVIGGVSAWVWKKRPAEARANDGATLKILRRTSIGVRSELIVVEMDGQRLLLGVTPNAVQNLYIAPFVEDAEERAREVAKSFAPQRARREDAPSPVSSRSPALESSRKSRTERIEDQALGIRSLLERQ